MSDSVIKHAYLENEDSDIILAFAADICDSVEKTAVATEAHAKNSWFYSVPVRRLCKATANIAIGANIVPGNGGNCVAQTIEELMANASNLAEPMSGDAFDDAVSLDDGIYPIQEEDLQVIKADMVECDDGNTVEEKLTELNADLMELSNVKYASWKNTEVSGSGQGSNTLMLSNGTYLVIGQAPYTDVEYTACIKTDDSSQVYIAEQSGKNMINMSTIFKVTNGSTHVWVANYSSATLTYQDISKGYIKAIRVGD